MLQCMKKNVLLFISILIFTCNVVGQTDNCGVSATLLTPGAFGAACSPVSGSTSSGFTDSNQGCTAGTEDDDVWYRFVATSTTHTITVDGASNFDAVLGVYSNCSGTTVSGGACVDATSANGIETCVVTGLTVGSTYYICVHDWDVGGGDFTICITTLPPVYTMSSGTTTVCNAIFQDNAGTGNYSNNQTLTQTFCPSTAGQCIKAVFTSFDLEDNFDYLSVYDGTSTAAPMILGSSFSATAPTTLTATNINSTGCLTFKFSSDGATVSSGWSANISCGSCVASPTSAVQQDCQGAATICSNQSVSGTSLGSGNYNDANLGLGNLGCLNDYAATPNGSAEHQSHWYFFSPSASGTIGMTIAPSSASTDYDWAIWGPYSNIPCPPTGAPLRCSAATAGNSTAGQTGMGNSAADTEEGSGGNGWVSTINVIAGQKYILFLDNWNATSAPYTLSWQLTNGASLGCIVLPMELISFTGTQKKEYNLIEWITNTEMDNDFFTLERSTNSYNWLPVAIIKGAGNSSKTLHYKFEDYGFSGSSSNYYRLKQTSYSKETKYSPVITIENDIDPQIKVTSVYPVPTSGKLNIDMIIPFKADLQISILSLAGNEIETINQIASEGRQTYTINTETYSKGMYILKITDAGSDFIYYSKFTKE